MESQENLIILYWNPRDSLHLQYSILLTMISGLYV